MLFVYVSTCIWDSGQYNYSMDNKRLSWTRKYNNNQFIIASRAYFQHLDRSDREDVRLHQPRCVNASAFGLRGYMDNTLPSRCYASPWSCVCVGFFLKLLRSPTVASEPGFMRWCYARVEHKWVVGDISHTAYQHVILWFSGIVGWSVPDRHYTYAYARLVLPTCFAHRWLAGVSFSNFSWTECGYARSLRRLKQH